MDPREELLALMILFGEALRLAFEPPRDRQGRFMYYRLNPDKSISPCGREEGMEYWSTSKGRILRTELPGGFWLSTIFMGINHGEPGGPPVLFESIFFGPNDQEISGGRYCSYDQATTGHWGLVRRYEGQQRPAPAPSRN